MFGTLLVLVAAAWGSSACAQNGHAVNTPTSLYDDATLLDPGVIAVDLYTAFSRSPEGYYLSAPGMDFTLGLNHRLELSTYSGGATAYYGSNLTYGLDDTYAGLKILAVTQGDQRPAIAVKPSIEYLSRSDWDAVLSPSRANFALPVLAEKDFEDWSLSYNAGYISRGVAFTSLKTEGDWWKKSSPALVISYFQYTKNLEALSQLGLNRRQLDVSLGFSHDITPHWSLFGDVGRSLGRLDSGSSSLEFTFGLTFTTHLWGGPHHPSP